MSIPRFSLSALTALLLAGSVPAPATHHTPGGPYLNVQQVADYVPLEVKMQYGMTTAVGEVMLAGLWNDGSNNVLDLFLLDANANGVTITETNTSVDSGQLFGLGDWCIGGELSVLPYIKDFNVNVARWGMGGITTNVIGASTSSQYTTTDCSTLDNGDFVISATNFDTRAIDYFRSTDQGVNWSLGTSFLPSLDTVIGPFNGGYRATAEAVGNAVGSVYQRSNGDLEAITIDPVSGTTMGPVPVFSHPDDVLNGFLKECDGLTYLGLAVGLCNSGDEAWLGWLDLTSGALATQKLNNVGPGAVLSFQGVSISAGVFPGGDFGSNPQYHNFTDQHTVVIEGPQGWEAPVFVPDYPFQGNGGPVDSVTVPSLERIYVTALAFGGAPATPYLAVATLDPALIEAPAGEMAIPSLSAWGMAAFVMLLLAIGVWTVRWRSR